MVKGQKPQGVSAATRAKIEKPVRLMVGAALALSALAILAVAVTRWLMPSCVKVHTPQNPGTMAQRIYRREPMKARPSHNEKPSR